MKLRNSLLTTRCVKATTNSAEVVRFGSMLPLGWAQHELIQFWNSTWKESEGAVNFVGIGKMTRSDGCSGRSGLVTNGERLTSSGAVKNDNINASGADKKAILKINSIIPFCLYPVLGSSYPP